MQHDDHSFRAFNLVWEPLFLNNILMYYNNYLVKMCILVFRF